MDGVRAVLFDLDGTLLDSIPAYFDLMASMLDAVGLPQAPREKVAEFMASGTSILEKMIPEREMYRKDELIKELLSVGRAKSLDIFKDEVKVVPGADKSLKHLRDLGIALGIVTTTQRKYLEKKLFALRREGLADFFKVMVATEDAPRVKPAPDPLLEGARRIGMPPSVCVYVGDSHVDIRAGHAAGMKTIGVLTGIDSRGTLEKEGANLIVESISELTKHFN
ncbi:MAG: hypothetical protein C0608_11265 [Deltaproteobacteria bacterium]|nr:MAG: hypothetical protein C0608_11265 [Deltaproteobacteria bacterium]